MRSHVRTETMTKIDLPTCGIAVMAKASKPGRTKTRLTPPLAPELAASLNTAFLQDVAANLIAAGEAGHIAGYMAFGPPEDARFFDFLPPEIAIFEAWRPTFGETLSGALHSVLSRGHAAACVLNADSPTLPVSILIEASQRLAAPGDRIVLGPSSDGGYYLLGVKTVHARLFQDIAWSTEVVLSQTLQRAEEAEVPVEMLPEWYDVDDAEGLVILRRELFDSIPFGAPTLKSSAAQHSRALLSSLPFGPTEKLS